MENQTDFKSKFNVAGFKTRLIANLLFSSSYNFRQNKVQAWYADLRALKAQFISKLDPDEREVLAGYEQIINKFLGCISDPATAGDYNDSMKKNSLVLAQVKPYILQYETKLMEVFDKKGYDVPESDSDSLWDE